MTIEIIEEPSCKNAVERWKFNHRTGRVIYWIECRVDCKACVKFDCELWS